MVVHARHFGVQPPVGRLERIPGTAGYELAAGLRSALPPSHVAISTDAGEQTEGYRASFFSRQQTHGSVADGLDRGAFRPLGAETPGRRLTSPRPAFLPSSAGKV